MPFYPNPDGGAPIFYQRSVGDVLELAEPPVGAVLLGTDPMFPPGHPDRNFQLGRDERGWYLFGREDVPRRMRWARVSRDWQPFTIVSLPAPVDGQRA